MGCSVSAVDHTAHVLGLTKPYRPRAQVAGAPVVKIKQAVAAGMAPRKAVKLHGHWLAKAVQDYLVRSLAL